MKAVYFASRGRHASTTDIWPLKRSETMRSEIHYFADDGTLIHVMRCPQEHSERVPRNPHTCPLCGGSGRGPVPPNTTTAVPDPCHPCSGTGIVWEP